jgi:dienelactone hydrolase
MLAACALACACSDNGTDAPGPCADSSRVFAMPTPLWEDSGTHVFMGPPAGDRAVTLLGEVRSSWHAELSEMAGSGWPARPTIVIPLSGTASSVDAGRITLFGPDGTEYPESFTASVENGGHSLLLKPEDAFPARLERVIVVVKTGALEGATPLPVCDAEGVPHPDYNDALERLPDSAEAELALPIGIADSSHELSRLFARIKAAPVLQVESIEARELSSFQERSPSPEVAALLSPTAASGILALPDYRGQDRRFTIGADGAPEPHGVTKPGFVVALPATGTAPYPFVIFQHGGTQDKADFFKLAGPLAAAGFAFVSIDLPYHGDRASPGGGNDLDILDFDSPLASRDNLRQAAADHLAVLSGIEQLNTSLAAVLGAPRALDPARAFYMGLSLGGISGSMTFASGELVKAGALFVGAGGYPEMLSYGFFSLYLNDIMQLETFERQIVLGFAELLMNGADPLAYGQRAEDGDSPPRPALFFQATDDPIIFMPASDRWARAYGADLALPSQHDVLGMQTIALPAADNFSWPDGSGSATRLLIHNPMSEVPSAERHGGLITMDYSQEMVAHCFRSLLDTGSCEAIDTGFSGR